jgi:hypothetical protein
MLTRSIAVDNNADGFTDTVALEILDTSGNVIAAGSATSVASRLK